MELITTRGLESRYSRKICPDGEVVTYQSAKLTFAGSNPALGSKIKIIDMESGAKR